MYPLRAIFCCGKPYPGYEELTPGKLKKDQASIPAKQSHFQNLLNDAARHTAEVAAAYLSAYKLNLDHQYAELMQSYDKMLIEKFSSDPKLQNVVLGAICSSSEKQNSKAMHDSLSLHLFTLFRVNHFKINLNFMHSSRGQVTDH